jgi:hypothetical protein
MSAKHPGSAEDGVLLCSPGVRLCAARTVLLWNMESFIEPPFMWPRTDFSRAVFTDPLRASGFPECGIGSEMQPQPMLLALVSR